MAPKKCFCCNKNITQKSPGLECSRCSKSVHATTICSKLTSKQLAALRNSEGLEWSCEDCLNNVSRRSSLFVPNEDSSDDEDRISGINQSKLIENITRETQKIIRTELSELTKALDHMSGQIADLENIVKKQDTTIKNLVNKNTELINKNKNLELRVLAVEQRVNEWEQKMLSCTMEVAGIPETPTINLNQILTKIADNLNVSIEDVVSTRRMPKPKDRPQPGHILVEVKSNDVRNRWVNAAKINELTVGNILTQPLLTDQKSRIYIREALTHHTKTLLYNAQQKLKPSYKFVWCKSGVIYVKKNEDKSRPHIVRSMSDIDTLIAKQPNV